MKVCIDCKLTLELTCFNKDKTKKDGLQSKCRDCGKKYTKKHYKNNKEVYSKKGKVNYLKNKDSVTKKHQEWRDKNPDYFKTWRKENPEKISELENNRCKEKIKVQHTTWRSKNKEYITLYNREYTKRRRKEDVQFKLAINLRGRLSKIIRNNKRAGSAVKDLGCTLGELKNHLESQFTEGMTWDNYGEWHIDHMYPLSRVDLTNREEFLKVCNYKNLQPLWAIDNLKKSNKLFF